MEDFVQKHLRLIAEEREEEISQGLSLLSTCLKNVKELECKGVCLSKLEVESQRIGLFGRHIVTFEPARHLGKSQLPANSITSGDIVGVFSNGQTQQLVSGIVVKSSETVVGVAFEDLPEELNWSNHGNTLQLVKLANDVTYKRMKRALEDIKSNRNIVSSHLVDVLFKASPPAPSHTKWSEAGTLSSNDVTFINPTLDNSQKRAVLFALSRRDVAIIHGPPGTGKTTTVIEYILQSILMNKKILACAPSNIAVDNLVERLASYKVNIVRLGHPARLDNTVLKYSLDNMLTSADGADIVLDVRKEMSTAWSKVGSAKNFTERRRWQNEARTLKKELLEREKKLLQQILRRADVILATNTGASAAGPLKHLPVDHFDIVVIDECAQSLEASCWIPITRASMCLLAGDHKQLPPTILSDKAACDGLSVSLMERLVLAYGDEITALLTTQYRMNEHIMKWPSEYLYNNSLTAHESVSSHLLKDLPTVAVTMATTSSLFFIDTAGCGLYETESSSEESKGNEGETELVLAHVKDLLLAGVPVNDIAIIAPYNLQVEMIKQKLEILSSKFEVRTVDGFQGREKEAVIISFTRSNKTGEVGFLREQRRTNVAVTRARRHLAIIGDSQTITHEPFIKGLIEYCTNHGEIHSAHEYMHIASQTDIKEESMPYTDLAEKEVISPREKAFTDSRLVEQRLLYEEQLKEFKFSDRASISFPNTLSSSSRKLIHELSEQLGLVHVSLAEGKERYIAVSKKDASSLNTSTSDSTISKATSTTGTTTANGVTGTTATANGVTATTTADGVTGTTATANGVTGTGTTATANGATATGTTATADGVTGTTATANGVTAIVSHQQRELVSIGQCVPPAIAGMWHCITCGFTLPEINKEIHQLRCEREKRRLEDIVKKCKGAERKVKETQKKKDSKPTALPDDLDSLLEEMKRNETICNFSSCKRKVNHLEIVCPYCHRKYCMTHNIAEVHGCEENARRIARQQLEKQLRGERVGKKADPTKRAHLQRKLDKKITDLSSGRERKKPSLS